MRRIKLNKVPNQSFTFETDVCSYDITLRQASESVLFCSMLLRPSSTGESIPLFSDIVVVANQVIIPFEFLEYGFGNFAFVTPDDEIPYYQHFDESHKLYYLKHDELGALDGNSRYPPTESFY